MISDPRCSFVNIYILVVFTEKPYVIPSGPFTSHATGVPVNFASDPM